MFKRYPTWLNMLIVASLPMMIGGFIIALASEDMLFLVIGIFGFALHMLAFWFAVRHNRWVYERKVTWDTMKAPVRLAVPVGDTQQPPSPAQSTRRYGASWY